MSLLLVVVLFFGCVSNTHSLLQIQKLSTGCHYFTIKCKFRRQITGRLQAQKDDKVTQSTNENLSLFLGQISSFCESFQGASKLRSHPGYAFGLGSDKWVFNGYAGTIDNWSSSSTGVQWMSKSVIVKEDAPAFTDDTLPRATAPASSSSSPIVPTDASDLSSSGAEFQIDFDAFVSTQKDIPFLKMRVKQRAGRLTLWLDYVPRYELLSHLQYYDTYYSGLDQAHYELLQRVEQTLSVAPLVAPQSVITRLMMTPLAVYLGGSSTDAEGVRLMSEAVATHLSRWKEWIDGSVNQVQLSANSTSNGSTTNLALRDVSLYQQWFQESKFSIAELIGGSFAPKATEVSLSIMGPEFIPITDVLSSPKKAPPVNGNQKR